MIRITDLEQTLLDSLYKPFHAGGPEVVFDAWRSAVDDGRIDEERMAGHLESMQYPATARRVSAMFQLLVHSLGHALRQLLDKAMATVDPGGPYAAISLLPGIDSDILNSDWLVRLP